jgi:hypothetical protein
MMKVTIPVRTVNPLNRREHWSSRAKRAREARAETFYSLKANKAPYTLPCTITVTRIAPRKLDAHDGLPAALKGVVDGVADYLMVKSDADQRLSWKYAQRAGEPHEYAVEVEIT